MKKILTEKIPALLLVLILLSCGAGCAAQGSRDDTLNSSAVPESDAAQSALSDLSDSEDGESSRVTVRIGALTGPTAMGISPMIADSAREDTSGISLSNDYEATIESTADELMTDFLQGNLDIALLPANMAATLYHKTEGELYVIDINTLGVLYVVTGDDSVVSIEDLRGRTIYLTGKGTTPDYALQYVLTKNHMLGEVTLEYKSEAAEVASVLSSDASLVGLLPQPYVTVACAQNEELKAVLSLDEEWQKVSTDGSRLVTGVTIASRTFLEENPDAVMGFLADHEACVRLAENQPELIASYVVELGIIAKEAVARKATPQCSISYYDGEEMKAMLSGYLQVLFSLNEKSVGGALPDDDFYFIPSSAE